MKDVIEVSSVRELNNCECGEAKFTNQPLCIACRHKEQERKKKDRPNERDCKGCADWRGGLCCFDDWDCKRDDKHETGTHSEKTEEVEMKKMTVRYDSTGMGSDEMAAMDDKTEAAALLHGFKFADSGYNTNTQERDMAFEKQE